MRPFFVKSIRWFFQSVLGKSISQKLIIFIYKASDINLLKLGYNSVGILNYKTMEISGEKHLLNNVVSPYLQVKHGAPIIMDVGANIGDFTKILQEEFTNSDIYSFEPNPNSFIKLSAVNLKSFNIALGEKVSTLKMFRPKNDLTSTHFSANKSFINYTNDIIEVSVPQTTIDIFMAENNINQIDFLKIDTEGHDINVLKGICQDNVQNITFIQFEMNEAMLENRVQLKDFYTILQGFEFYRLMPKSLLYLGEYSTLNEIFRYQNILAVNKTLHPDRIC